MNTDRPVNTHFALEAPKPLKRQCSTRSHSRQTIKGVNHISNEPLTRFKWVQGHRQQSKSVIRRHRVSIVQGRTKTCLRWYLINNLVPASDKRLKTHLQSTIKKNKVALATAATVEKVNTRSLRPNTKGRHRNAPPSITHQQLSPNKLQKAWNASPINC